MPTKFASLIGALALLAGASGSFANEGEHAGWQREADNEVANLPSLQRGARNFMSYCSGCHSIIPSLRRRSDLTRSAAGR